MVMVDVYNRAWSLRNTCISLISLSISHKPSGSRALITFKIVFEFFKFALINLGHAIADE